MIYSGIIFRQGVTVALGYAPLFDPRIVNDGRALPRVVIFVISVESLGTLIIHQVMAGADRLPSNLRAVSSAGAVPGIVNASDPGMVGRARSFSRHSTSRHTSLAPLLRSRVYEPSRPDP